VVRVPYSLIPDPPHVRRRHHRFPSPVIPRPALPASPVPFPTCMSRIVVIWLQQLSSCGVSIWRRLRLELQDHKKLTPSGCACCRTVWLYLVRAEIWLLCFNLVLLVLYSYSESPCSGLQDTHAWKCKFNSQFFNRYMLITASSLSKHTVKMNKDL
jgi:hypothetical protein